MVLTLWEPALASLAVIILTLLLVNVALSVVARLVAFIGRQLIRPDQ